jgi:hypothetical protein
MTGRETESLLVIQTQSGDVALPWKTGPKSSSILVRQPCIERLWEQNQKVTCGASVKVKRSD